MYAILVIDKVCDALSANPIKNEPNPHHATEKLNNAQILWDFVLPYTTKINTNNEEVRPSIKPDIAKSFAFKNRLVYIKFLLAPN